MTPKDTRYFPPVGAGGDPGAAIVSGAGIPATSKLGSRFVREIAKYGGSIDHLVPAHVADALRRVNDGAQN